MFVLFETPAGYALFKAAKELRKASTDEIWKHFASADAAAASLKLKAFQPFADTATALSAATALVDGTLDDTLTSFIRRQSEKAGGKLTLGLADAKIGAALTKALPVNAVCDPQINEVLRGIRQHSSTLISGVTADDTHAMQLGVAHSLCRYKLRFSPDKVDTMIIQAIALLDELDKELNSYAMRVREWYGWHFPEMGKIIADNIQYAKTVQAMRIRTNAHSSDLSGILAEDVESSVKEAAEVSMGTEIADEDIDNISALCAQVISISEYRASLYDYLRERMTAIAPNLTVMVGELVGARLIAHAGSLMSLAKQPASTVQILGAEKALFRALKTKADTPKYGLIYHASLVGQAAPKMKGKVSRMLAAKAALSVRMDALGEQEGASIGLRAREQVELRLKQLESGSAQTTSGNSKGFKQEQQRYSKPTNIKSYNTAADSTANISVKRESMNGNGQVKAEVPATRPHSEITSNATSSSNTEEPKKKKKKLIEVVAASTDDADDDEAVTSSSNKKNKKRKAQTEPESVTETITAPSEKKKKKKKNNDDE